MLTWSNDWFDIGMCFNISGDGDFRPFVVHRIFYPVSVFNERLLQRSSRSNAACGKVMRVRSFGGKYDENQNGMMRRSDGSEKSKQVWIEVKQKR